jgi:Response regulator containing a CheY-like receiver domain and an HTH DNA-binding domain
MTNQSATIAIVDDHAVMRKGMTFRLKTVGFNVIMEAENGKQFLDQLKNGTVPDVCILDINMPVMNGFETLKRLKAEFPEMRVIFFSMNDDKTYIDKAMEMGADAYVTKDAPVTEMDRVLAQVCAGKRMGVAV